MFQPAVGHCPAPGIGTLPRTWLDRPLLQRALRSVSGPAAAAGWLQYGHPAGDPGLRQALARRLADLGVAASPSRSSRRSARPMGWTSSRARCCSPAMRCWSTSPAGRSSLRVWRAWACACCRCRAARRARTSAVMEAPAAGAPAAPVRHGVGAAQPDRRVAVGRGRRTRCCGWPRLHDLTIVEDDTYAWLAPPHAPRLSALDGLRRTVLVSGFSKILAPQWRVGFVAARAGAGRAPRRHQAARPR